MSQKSPVKLSEKKIDGEIQWGKWTIRVDAKKPLRVRSWKPGDRFQPNGMEGSKKLQDFFVDSKVPKNKRHEIPIIVDEKDAIIRVGNLRYASSKKSLADKIEIEELS